MARTEIKMGWYFSMSNNTPAKVNLAIEFDETMTSDEFHQVGAVVQEIELLITKAKGQEEDEEPT